jgi:hypothetical protein
MLSAYCGLESAPDGDSVTVVRPFQAKPSEYRLTHQECTKPRGQRLSHTGVHQRGPTAGLSFFLLPFPLEEQLINVVIQVIGRKKSVKYTHWQRGNLTWKIAVRISINDRYHISQLVRIWSIISEFGIRIIAP